MAVGEWDQRQLCPDGSCIGVIGPEGTCKVCGRAAPNWGDERKRGLIEPEDDDEDEDDEDDDLDADDGYDEDDDEDDDLPGDDEAAAADLAVAGAARGDWSVRRLCPDGACIGVLGADGRCKVCGRSGWGFPTEAASQATGDAHADGASGGGAAASNGGSAASDAAASDAAASDAAASDAAASDAAASDAATSDAATSDAATGDVAPGTRERCSDAGCTGTIGADGRCEVCGKGAS